MTDRRDDDDEYWQPATSAPGELYTFEGQMRSYAAFGRNLKNDDPRLDDYRRSMTGAAKVFLAIAAGVIVVSILLSML